MGKTLAKFVFDRAEKKPRRIFGIPGHCEGRSEALSTRDGWGACRGSAGAGAKKPRGSAEQPARSTARKQARMARPHDSRGGASSARGCLGLCRVMLDVDVRVVTQLSILEATHFLRGGISGEPASLARVHGQRT